MTQADPQIAFQMNFQKLMHGVFSQTNSCIQEVNDYMYQLQMSLLFQTSQIPQQQQQCSYMPMQMPSQMTTMAPQCSSYMSMPMPFQMGQQMPSIMPQQQWQQPQQPQCTYMPMMQMPQMASIQQQQQWQQPLMNVSQTVAPAITPVIIQPPTPPPSVPKPTAAPKVTITPPPPPPASDDAPVVKLRAKPKVSSGQLTPPSPINSNRNSLIDELRNSGGRKSLRKIAPRKESVPKKEEPLPAWVRSRDREKRSSFNPPADFDTLEAFLLASTKDHQKSMPNLRTLSRANSDERKSPPAISPLAAATTRSRKSSRAASQSSPAITEPSCATSTDEKAQKPTPPTNTNVANAIKAALESSINPSPESSHTSSTELIPIDGNEDVEEALEVDYDPHPSSSLIIAIPTTRALVPHRQLNPQYPEAPHGWHLLMWTIRKVGKFLKKHDLENSKKDGWELVHHRH